MALNWNAENIKYFKKNPDDLWVKYHEGTVEEYEDINAETKSLIFSTMSIGIGSLDYRSAPDFYARIRVLEDYEDFYLYSRHENGQWVNIGITPATVVKHLGLATNVSFESQKDWVNRVFKRFQRDGIEGTIKDLNKALKFYKQEYELNAL